MDVSLYREAMAHLGAAVNVVTSDGTAGLAGLTASAVCSVTDTPPTLLICMNRNAFQYPRFVENGVLCVNVLRGAQQHLSGLFAGAVKNASIKDRFAAADWTRLDTGAPVLNDSLTSFDCTIDEIQDVGTHSVFFCRVQAVRQTDQDQGDGLLYFKREYHRVPSASEPVRASA